MPELCRFYGIIIRMYFTDHPPPHFHAEYGEFEALLSVEACELIEGKLPRRALGLVMEWWHLHKDELDELWDFARKSEPLRKLKPLE